MIKRRTLQSSLRLSAIIYALGAQPATAAEAVTYEYDALGRLIKTTKSGGPASGVQNTTNYDSAGNRTNQTTTGAPPPPPPAP